ncbi:NAD(P)-dependent oxidoreductase [Agrilactobacillus yilanensis]|uniref:NAD(P)-dependent oxidoreductase n=1 Tax=Agrilactobacillus yilanensis TaxID=2485997 RepID=A0ABW4J6J4_9LACO|nr:NAD(P)H-binding protein [Agrilactobacillus yilanensis]
MKIIVIGAYGKSGRELVATAEKNGHDVLAVAHRKHADIKFKHELIKSGLDLTAADIAGYDVIIDAISAWTPDTFPIHTDTAMHIAHLIKGTTTRYIKIGGAGTMYINDEHTKMLRDWSDYPEANLPLAEVLITNLDRIRSYSDMAWTYVTPAFNYDPDGKYTGQYQIAGEDMNLNTLLKSYISYKDMAKAIIDLVEQQRYIRQRIIVLN